MSYFNHLTYYFNKITYKLFSCKHFYNICFIHFINICDSITNMMGKNGSMIFLYNKQCKIKWYSSSTTRLPYIWQRLSTKCIFPHLHIYLLAKFNNETVQDMFSIHERQCVWRYTLLQHQCYILCFVITKYIIQQNIFENY